MQIRDILRQLKRYNGTFPRDAVQAAIAQQKQITPELLKILEQATVKANDLLDYPNYMGHFYAMYLLAQFREARAYPLLVDFCTIDPETLHFLLGDTLTEDLNRILASVSGGDPEPMKSLVENAAINEYARSAALGGLATLVAQGAQSRADIMAYFQSLFRETLPRAKDFIWNALVSTSTRLYPDLVYDDIKQAYADKLVDPMYISLKNVDESMAQGKEAVLEDLKTYWHYTYIDDTIKELETWASFQPPEPRQAPGQIVNTRKVGRNDPCPCGSGQKYKRCCGKQP